MAKVCVLADAESIHTKKWVEYFVQLGHDVHLISMRDTQYMYPSSVHLYIIKPPLRSKLSYFLLIPKVRNIIKKIQPDILHSYYASSYGMLGMLCNFHPYIVSAWGSDIYEFPKSSFLNRSLLSKILNSAEVVCSTSKDMASEIKKYYDGEIVLTPFGVDTNKFKCITPIFSKEYVTIGINKGLEKIYGINYLIEAFAQLYNDWKQDKLRLMIVGDGSERKNLEFLCKDKGIESKVTFVGRVENDEIPRYLNNMDIVCFPSLSESFGVAAVEAGACCRPVIASKVGGLKEVIVDEHSGYLVDKENSEVIKEKIEFILANKNKAVEIGENARNYINKNYSWQSNTEIMRKLYSRYIKSDI
ncbi:glycosyltransferase [Clostridium sp. ZS2-4]|uniref:glycosyltransferase n=1 Tax=Clostridium sp. ZS2-4 TaxID=2987703 RepID=UPI00227ABCF0|nr:glycosyltransferase [Clostridium sp. ZS2-4]MCY6353884.1 glycosyltransferase [Clostridium sp. ZS2-4]